MVESNPGKKGNRSSGPENNPNIARSFQITYDAYGNVAEKGGLHYEYDFENHLVRVRDAKGKLLVENVYDAGGQRVLQRTPQEAIVYIDGIYEEGKTHTSRHVQAGPLLIATIARPRSLAESADGVLPNAYNALAGVAGVAFILVWLPFRHTGRRKWLAKFSTLKEAIRAHPRKLLVLIVIVAAIVSSAAAPEFSAQASLALRSSEKCYYYHANHLGSINVVTDEKGKVVERREYKPYGDPYEWTGPQSGPREFLQTFDGQYYDDATGLYYFGARHYDPQLGRFLAADTQVPDPTNPRSLHRYAFAGGNPIRYVDPTGHAWYDWIIGIAVAFACVVLAVVTFGAALAVIAPGLAALAAGVLFTIAASALMAGAFTVYALASNMSPLNSDFWLTVAAGAVIGAAVGACIAAIPLSLGFAPALGTAASFFAGLAADVLVGAVLAGMGTVMNHLASGGSPADIFSESLGLEILTSSIKGALVGLSIGICMNAFALADITFITVVAGIISGLFTLEAMAEIGLNVWQPNRFGSLGNIFGTDANWFKNSPSKSLGIPTWAFEGTWAWGGAGQHSRALARQLQTMPLAP
jgi:RHS repeat-associated protein